MIIYLYVKKTDGQGGRTGRTYRQLWNYMPLPDPIENGGA